MFGKKKTQNLKFLCLYYFMEKNMKFEMLIQLWFFNSFI